MLFVNVEAGHYRILSPSGMVVAEVRRGWDHSRPSFAKLYGQVTKVPKRIWKVTWNELKDEYGTYTNPPEEFDTLKEIQNKYMFSNYPGWGHVLRR